MNVEVKLFLGLARIGRLRYGLYHLLLLGVMLFATDVSFLTISIDEATTYLVVVFIVLGAMSLKFDIQRLRDMGWSPLLVLLQVIPGVVLLKIIVLLSVRGKEGEYNYLPAPPESQKNAIGLGLLFVPLLIIHLVTVLVFN